MRITLRHEDALRNLKENARSVQTALRLASAREAIKKNFVLQVTLEEYAANLPRIERTYFCWAFKKHMGIGFAAWLREI